MSGPLACEGRSRLSERTLAGPNLCSEAWYVRQVARPNLLRPRRRVLPARIGHVVPWHESDWPAIAVLLSLRRREYVPLAPSTPLADNLTVTAEAKHLIEDFEKLSDIEKREVLSELLHVAQMLEYPTTTEEEL